MRLGHRELIRPVVAMTLVLVTLVGCRPAGPEPSDEHMPASLRPVPLEQDEFLRVVATTNIVGDVVGEVGGDRIELTTLMGTGVDPHGFVPTPSSSAAIYDAHVVFLSGAGLETSLEEMLKEAGGSAARVELSEGLDLLEAPGHDPQGEGEVEAGRRASSEEGDHGHGDHDPHVWFSVANAVAWVETIEETLSALDPDGAETYSRNSQDYIRELEALDAWVMEEVALIPEANRRLVTNHPSFGYLADRYGLEQVGAVYPISPSSEPSAQDIAALEDVIREFGVPAVFTESTANPKLAEQVASDTGVSLVPLYSGSVGAPGSGAESYILLIRFDVEAIVEALK